MPLSKVPGSLSELEAIASLACSTRPRDCMKVPQLHVLQEWTLKREGWLPAKTVGEPVSGSFPAGPRKCEWWRCPGCVPRARPNLTDGSSKGLQPRCSLTLLKLSLRLCYPWGARGETERSPGQAGAFFKGNFFFS